MNHSTNAELVKRPPLEGFIRSPPGLFARFAHYAVRYGLIHAVCSYIGRHSFWFWTFAGPFVTGRYLRRWLRGPGPHILNLGGGGVLFTRWLTADVDPRSDVFVDIRKPLPFPECSVDVVYSEEVIEHISREHGNEMLRQCFLVLKPGGYLRLTTPCLDYFAGRAMEVPSGVDEINDIFYLHAHRHIYSKRELREALVSAGFTDISPSSYRDPVSRYGYFDTHPVRHSFAPPEWSQYWEARKPEVR